MDELLVATTLPRRPAASDSLHDATVNLIARNRLYGNGWISLVAVDPVEDVVVRAHHKGFPPRAVGRAVGELHGRLTLTDHGFVTPVLLLVEEALEHNLRAVREFCEAAQLSLAPHAKTTMSPEIVTRQVQHGVWGMTAANVTQAMTLRRMNVTRIVIANELVDPNAIEWLGNEMDRDEDFIGYCYVDSTQGVQVLEDVLVGRGQRRAVPVMIEYGEGAGRGGARSLQDAMRLAPVVHDSPSLQLAGVAGFEGIVGEGLGSERLDEVDRYLKNLREVADHLYGERAGEELIVTVGGSCFLELVADVFDTEWRGDRPIRVVPRSGCYVAHDSGGYESCRTLVAGRYEPIKLSAAVELWSRVISRPEPGLAIVDAGRRDVGTDAGLPLPQHVLRSGDPSVEPCPEATIVDINDQHAYLRAAPDSAPLDLEVGDLIGFGISHPCTTLDKWRLIPIVDADRTLVGAARTWF